MKLFKYAPALLPACRRLQNGPIFDPQIPKDVQDEIVRQLDGAAFQFGALHALQEVETWLRDNHLKITKEQQCASQFAEPEELSAGTS